MRFEGNGQKSSSLATESVGQGEKIATVVKAANIPRRTLRDHMLLETHSKTLGTNRILSEEEEEEESQLVERNDCSSLDTAFLKCACVKLYFSFAFPATLSTSFVAVQLDEDVSKASFYATLSHPAMAASCGLMECVTIALTVIVNKGSGQCMFTFFIINNNNKLFSTYVLYNFL
jgi:hypothetical protein